MTNRAWTAINNPLFIVTSLLVLGIVLAIVGFLAQAVLLFQLGATLFAITLAVIYLSAV